VTQRAEYWREYAARNRDRIKARRAVYRAENRETLRKKQSEYYNANRDKARAYREKNKERRAVQIAEWRKRNHYKLRTAELAHTGFTVESFEAQLKAQNYRCAICNKRFSTALADKACADHCHTSGKPRALLCANCNVGLGHFKDNPEALRAAAKYLEKHS
jgi:hypothetical protein